MMMVGWGRQHLAVIGRLDFDGWHARSVTRMNETRNIKTPHSPHSARVPAATLPESAPKYQPSPHQAAVLLPPYWDPARALSILNPKITHACERGVVF